MEDDTMLWKSSDIESLDYDLFESVVNKSGMSYKYRNGIEKNRLVYARWVLTMLTGVATALVAVFLLYCTTLLASLKQHLLVSSIEHTRLQEQQPTLWSVPLGCLLLFNATLVAIAATLTSYGEPVAAGSGISEVKTMLNGMKIPRMLRFRTLVCKVLGTICTVAGGLPVGKEGPMIHSGAIVAAGISQGKSSTMGYDTSFTYFAGFRNDHEKRDFVSCGAAAGVAAAFGAPIGGVLFVLEEGASFWNQTLTWRTLFCAMAATFTLAFFLSGINDTLDWGTLGSHTGTFTFGSFASSTYQIWEVPLFILIGIGGGLQGALFNSLNTRLTRVRSRWVRTRRRAWVEAIVVSLVISTVVFAVPFAWGQCLQIPVMPRDAADSRQPPLSIAMSHLLKTHDNHTTCVCDSCSAVDPTIACFAPLHTPLTTPEAPYPYVRELVQFYCPPGEYNDLATLLLSPGEVAIKHLFHAPPDTFGVTNLVVFWGLLFVLACGTYGLKVPSGLFVPALLIGAAYGRLWTRVINYFTLRLALKTIDPRTYGLIGSCAMLGGVTRMTISLTVIMLECTGNIEFGLPLILTSFFARWVGNWVNEGGIYDIHIHLRHVPFLDWNPSLRGSFLRVKHIMTPNPKTLRIVERAGVVFDLLVSTEHNGFPVIVDDPTFGSRFFAGVILRKQLNVILSHRDWHATKPIPFQRQPPPMTHSDETDSAHRTRRWRERRQRRHVWGKQSGSFDANDALLGHSTDSTDGTFCLSYRDMEAHYPRYPTPTLMGHSNRRSGGSFNNPPSGHNQQYTLSEADRSLWVDLTPYLNPTPFVIQEEAPFVRAYRLFRSAGLRHLVVVNRHNNVRGIITRRELEEEHCARSFRLAKHVDPDDLYPISQAPIRESGSFVGRKLKRVVSRTEQVKRALSSVSGGITSGTNGNMLPR